MKPSGTSLKHPLKNPRRKTSSGVSFSGSSLFFPFRLESFPTSGRKYIGDLLSRSFVFAMYRRVEVCGDDAFGDCSPDDAAFEQIAGVVERGTEEGGMTLLTIVLIIVIMA